MTGAEILHGGALPFNYGRSLTDGQEFTLGDVRIKALATPGHTYEHFCFSLTDPATGDEPVMVFTGDALFAGDVGRTDLPAQNIGRSFPICCSIRCSTRSSRWGWESFVLPGAWCRFGLRR